MNKEVENTYKELNISDVSDSDNHTRFYIPTDQKKLTH
jgi:hypothetical protein